MIRLTTIIFVARLGMCFGFVGCVSNPSGAVARTPHPTQSAASSAPPSAPQPRRPAAEDAQCEAEEGERWVRERVPLQSENTSVELFAHPGARVQLLRIVGGIAVARVSAFETTDEYDYEDPLIAEHYASDEYAELVVTLPASVLSKTEVPLQVAPAREDARDHGRMLYDSATATSRGLKLACGPVEIMADLPGDVQRLRQIRDGVEVRGFTRLPLKWSWGANHCRERLSVSELCADTSTPVPAGFVASDLRARAAAKRYLERGTSLYEVTFSEAGLSCTKVRFRLGDLIFETKTGKGLERNVTKYSGFISREGAMELDGPLSETFDERGHKTRGVAFGCISMAQLLRETPEALELTNRAVQPGDGAPSVITYHPDDVTHWYKTERGCRQAIAEHPRVRLVPGQSATAVATALNQFHGC